MINDYIILLNIFESPGKIFVFSGIISLYGTSV